MDQCSEVDTPITKNGQDSLNNGEELHEEEARRAIARINYMAQDRPAISVAARVLSHCMAGPREGVLPAIKLVIRYLRRYPRCIIEINSDQQVTELDVWTDSDWAGNVETRKSCSGGSLQLGTSPLVKTSGECGIIQRRG